MSDPHAPAVLEHLRETGIPIGDAAPPDEPWGWQGPPGHSAFVGYGILWPGGGLSVRSATIEDQFEVGIPRFYVRVFAESAPAVRGLHATVRDQMLHVPLAVPGRTVHQVRPDDDSVMRESNDTEVGLFEWTTAYRVHTSPA
jgi:hypothetical protein